MAQIDLPGMTQIDLPGLAEIPWHIPYTTVTTSTRIGRNRATRYGMLLHLPTLVEINLPDYGMLLHEKNVSTIYGRYPPFSVT